MDYVSFYDVLDDYFISKGLRPAYEWSYIKVVRTFIELRGRHLSRKYYSDGCSEMAASYNY